MTTLNLQISIEKINYSRIKEQDINNSSFGKVFSDRMLVADYRDGNWQEVKIVPYGNIPMAPSLSVLHYGQTVFEGLKAYRSPTGKPLLFRPEANYKRINESAFRLCMPPIPEDIFLDGLKELIRLDSDWIPTQSGSVLYIRPIYFATDESVGLKPANSYKFIIISCPVGAYYSEPVKLIVTDKYIRAAEGGTGAAKCAGNYGGSLLADKEAKQLGYDNVLWLDGKEKKYIEECGTMNVAFVIND
ncbi:MAG: branched-chain amino acid aminotransferase, partial [Okeania sp. SIO3B3]|nr:branched-chain amino acid aminotransferase [Okeania sp. SIO3B3]